MNAKFPLYVHASSPAKSLSTWATATAALCFGAYKTLACVPTAQPGAARPRLSGPSSNLFLLAAPTTAYDTPEYAEPKVHPDHHVEVLRAIYSIPGDDMVGKRVHARVDSNTAKFYFKGQLVKVHPRQAPGGRSTDPADLPSERTAYAMRDINHLVALGREKGDAIGAYLEALMACPLPWTRMRQAYRLLGLVKKWGPERVEAACAKALDAEAVNVNLIGRMLERAKEADEAEAGKDEAPKNIVAGRFARDPSEFKAKGEAR